MTQVRLISTGPWNRVLVDDKGKYSGTETYLPGDTIDLPKDVAESLVGDGSIPINARSFVIAGSDEDTWEPDVEDVEEVPAPTTPKTAPRTTTTSTTKG